LRLRTAAHDRTGAPLPRLERALGEQLGSGSASVASIAGLPRVFGCTLDAATASSWSFIAYIVRTFHEPGQPSLGEPPKIRALDQGQRSSGLFIAEETPEEALAVHEKVMSDREMLGVHNAGRCAEPNGPCDS
jgi:hypothetical protein